jgi:hypothetical protein
MKKMILSIIICIFTAINSFAQGFVEDFEGDVSAWKLVNGSETNQWVISSATSYDGSKSAYISNNGSDNVYTINAKSVVHLYRDITLDDEFNNVLSFYWKGQGERNYDDLKVYLASTSTTPTAGIQLSNSDLLGTFNGSASWQQGIVDLSAYTGTIRLVFSWRNDDSDGSNPPIAIDNIKFIKINDNYSGGNGTEQTPFLISSKEDMLTLALIVNGGNRYLGRYFLLTQDLTGANDTITTIIGYSDEHFDGIFDGGNHIVAVNIDLSEPYIGVFGRVDNAIIKNLGVTGKVRGDALVSTGTYPNGNAYIFVTDCYSGGICGRASANSTITNCYNTCRVDGNSSVGGRIQIYTNSYSGGICGYADSGTNISNCYNTGDVSANTVSNNRASAGGICGVIYDTAISNCYNTGNISGQSGGNLYSGGICGRVGDSNVNISNCFAANSAINASTAYAWRIAEDVATINSCYALFSMKINGSTKSSQDPMSANGKNASLSDFQSQSWITQNLAWDFNEIWTMSNINSIYQGLPVLRGFNNTTNIPPIAVQDTKTVSVYPNPAKHDLFIQSDSPIEKVEIYNPSGLRVLAEDNFAEKIAVSHLADGIYFVRTYGSDWVNTQKVIVVR